MLALGFVNYRTQSLPASILTHFGANGLAALMVTHQVFPTGIQNWITTIPAVIGGLVLAGAALMALVRLTTVRPAGVIGIESTTPQTGERLRLSTAWPLLLALIIFVTMVGIEWVYSRSPQAVGGLLASGPALRVGKSPWSTPQAWRYEIRNVADDIVGEGECSLTPEGDEIELTCTSTVQAYEVRHGQGTYSSSGGSRVDVFRWQTDNGKFISGSSTLDLQTNFHSQIDFAYGVDRIEIQYREIDQEEKRMDLLFDQTALSSDPSLLLAPDNTWPWQLAGIFDAEFGFESDANGAVLRFNPYTWNNETRLDGPLAEPHLIEVGALEEIDTTAGIYQAMTIRNGDRDVAWYGTRNGTLTVLQYFNGVETWTIKE